MSMHKYQFTEKEVELPFGLDFSSDSKNVKLNKMPACMPGELSFSVQREITLL